MLGIVALLVGLQDPQSPRASPPTEPPRAPVVVRAIQAPAIDGRDDDPVWRTALVITDFHEWSPREAGPARFPTELRITFDAANLYVFVRCFDPHPDSIIRRLARRDDFPESDRVIIVVDSYHDRRTGYEFGVTAAGGRYDAAVYNDGNEDSAWDAVWDVATRIDSLGWTAEFRIPLSQLRYGPERTHIFGVAVDRDIFRYTERLSWPQLRQSQAGLVSQAADVAGFDDLEAPRRLEAAPYVVTKNISRVTATGFAREQDVSAGADLKYRVAPNLTLDATVNPDFGQVEADPAVLNLTAFETFFPERRPFFVAGQGLFRVPLNCNNVNCGSDGLYYSRRIGRAPQLAGAYSDTTSPAFTTILGAAKLTGRLAGGLRLGFLDAVTAHTTGINGVTIEPAANYAVLRLQQDYRHGEGSVSGTLTAVNRSLDSFSEPYLRRSAYAGGVDVRHRFLNRMYEVSASLDASRVEGTAPVIAATQRNAVHFLQRPDTRLGYDSTRTSLTGDAEELKFGKVGGRHLMFETAWERQSPGFEVNDLGYLQRAGEQSWTNWAGYFDRHVRRFYQYFQWNVDWLQLWTAGGLPTERAANSNLHATLRNYWGLNLGATWGQLGATWCDVCSRCGPAVRQDPYISPWFGVSGDNRWSIVPELYFNYFHGGAGHKEEFELSPELGFRFGHRASGSLSLDWSKNDNGYQWYANLTDSIGTTHYTFARLKQRTVGITARFDMTFSPTMTLQVYAQPYVTKGTFSDVRELSATPRASRYEDRYQPYADASVAGNPGGFNYKQLRTNVVFRWEYRPGSTLFLVWSQGRQGQQPNEGTSSWDRDIGDLFRLRPDNTFLVKMSYWLNR